MSFKELTFFALAKLEVLSINHNQIHVLKSDMFAGLDNLVDLRLEENKISRIESNSFDGLINLRVLTLSHNRLKALPPSSFKPLSKLQLLKLSWNPLKQLNRNSIKPLQGTLSKLFVASCNMTSISKKIFNNFTSLTTLVMADNHLKVVPNLGYMPSLVSANFSHNFLQCTKNASSMLRWIRRHSNANITAKCRSPASRNNTDLSIYTLSQLLNGDEVKVVSKQALTTTTTPSTTLTYTKTEMTSRRTERESLRTSKATKLPITETRKVMNATDAASTANLNFFHRSWK